MPDALNLYLQFVHREVICSRAHDSDWNPKGLRESLRVIARGWFSEPWTQSEKVPLIHRHLARVEVWTNDEPDGVGIGFVQIDPRVGGVDWYLQETLVHLQIPEFLMRAICAVQGDEVLCVEINLDESKDGLTYRLSWENARLTEAALQPLQAIARRVCNQFFRQELSDYWILYNRGENTRLAIIDEFAESVWMRPQPLLQVHDRMVALTRILEDLPMAVQAVHDQRHQAGSSSSVDLSLWQLTGSHLLAKTEPLSENARHFYRGGYSRLWWHADLQRLPEQGDAAVDWDGRGHALRSESLEGVASTLVSLPGLLSPRLSRLLLDALVCEACLVHARHERDKERPKRLRDAKWWAILLGEVIALVLSLCVAWVFSGENPIVFWLLFGFLTVPRWTVQRLRYWLETQIPSPSSLLEDMVRTYDQLRYSFPNYAQFRADLLNCQARGARFSPYVFHLLDRMDEVSHKSDS